MGLWDNIKNSISGNADLSTKYQEYVDKLINEKSQQRCYAWDISLQDSETGKIILAFESDDVKGLLEYCINNTLTFSQQQKLNTDIPSLYISNLDHRRASYVIEMQIIRHLVSGKPTLTKKQLLQLLDWLNTFQRISNFSLPITQIITIAEKIIQPQDFDLNLNRKLGGLKNQLTTGYRDKETRKLKERVSALLGEKFNLNPGDVWTDAAIAYLDSINAEQKTLWNMILDFARQSDASKPSKKWLAGMKEALLDIDEDIFFEKCREWFLLANQPRETPIDTAYRTLDPYILDDANSDVLKGLVWSCALAESADNARSLVKLATSCYKKIPGVGPRAVRIGNACIAALAAMPGRIGLYHLAVMQMKLKYRSALKLVTNALEEAAKREGISVQELEEMGVPSYGLDGVGYGEEIIGDYTAILNVTPQKTVELTWRTAQEKIQKTIPAVIKSNFAQELKELRGAMADIKTMISAQKDRLEKMFLQEPRWTFDIWQERYLNHPIVGIHARKLIWEFSRDGSPLQGIYHDGKIVDSKGTELTLDNSWKVKLWHPINSTIDLIKDWRNQIEALQTVQPFKQAHREIYLLTDAELNTRVYSNRFASHIIKQHQFNALCGARGWRYNLQGAWDGGDVIAKLDLDRFNLWAEFWVHAIGEYGADTSAAGIFNYVSTDQVRFYAKQKSINEINETNINNVTPIALSEINPLVFSEVFRDVDLFVGVCSVGNDTQWSDGGADERFRAYWNTYSFGDLSASAETRKEFLQKLLPRLKIASQCKIVDKFLVVAGKRRTYKIHLGSGNILMEPNNQYLCIVPSGKDKTKGESIFLPFEGDNMLSIILSKAMMLAEDDKIKDSSINSQIAN